MTFYEWHERCIYGASMLRQDAKILERAIRSNASDDVCNGILERIKDDVKKAFTSRSLIVEDRNDEVEVIK